MMKYALSFCVVGALLLALAGGCMEHSGKYKRIQAQLDSVRLAVAAMDAEIDKQMYSGFYIIGNKSDLIAAQVLSKGGLFRAAKVSYLAEKTAFQQIDIRRTFDIPIEAKTAKVLSIHPAGTYTLDADDNGLLVLHMVQPDLFWKQTKYIVIKTD